MQNPLFGNLFFIENMEGLRQGQGIIDLVNVYAAVALKSGLVGLFLFLIGFVLVFILNISKLMKFEVVDKDDFRARASIIVAMAGTLLMLANSSFIESLAYMYWILLGVGCRVLYLPGGDRAIQTRK
jgi:hypothetical protein